MEIYYFIEKQGLKQGPFKLSELKEHNIYYDYLIWRSDNDKWLRADEIEELKDIVIVKPPPIPTEIKTDLNRSIAVKTLKSSLITYIIVSLVLSGVSYGIAESSWKTYRITKSREGNIAETNSDNLQKTKSWITDDSTALLNDRSKLSIIYLQINKYHYKRIPDSLFREINNLHRDSLEHYNDSSVETDFINDPKYNQTQDESNMLTPHQIFYENENALSQSFWFRPFKAFYSTVYLTTSEQINSATLFLNLTLSSFTSLFFVFLIIGLLYYELSPK